MRSWLVAAALIANTLGFQSLSTPNSRDRWSLSSGKGFGKATPEIDPLDELSDERKANLFQFMLRDLQVEQVPLLGVDANQVHTLQAAMWTILSEMADKSGTDKACVVLEEIPIEALRAFVDDFMVLKTERPHLTKHLKELERFNLSLLGKGVGPAIVIEMTERSEETSTDKKVDESKLQKSMQSYISRSSRLLSIPTVLAETERQALVYRTCQSSNVCNILSSFWNVVCEVLASESKDVSASVLLLPSLMEHAVWASRVELISRSLCLYRGDALLHLEHHHPNYDRGEIHPAEKPAHGHVPPISYIRPMVELIESGCPNDELIREANNAQRQSPVPAVIIRREELVDQATDTSNGIVSLTVEGRSVPASGVPAYSKNIHLLTTELDTWSADLAREQTAWME